MTQYLKIAAGANNTGGLATLDQLSVGLFATYELGDVLTEWNDYEGRAADANRNWRSIGLPWCVWIFPGITMSEYQILKDDFVPMLALNGAVTITAFNKTLNTYRNYNANLLWPDQSEQQWIRGSWGNVRLTFLDLQLITAFSTAFDLKTFGE